MKDKGIRKLNRNHNLAPGNVRVYQGKMSTSISTRKGQNVSFACACACAYFSCVMLILPFGTGME